jgi:transposase
VPDHKTIADFRKDNGGAICQVCARFVALCRAMGLLTEASVAIDGSKFKAVNNRDQNFTRAETFLHGQDPTRTSAKAGNFALCPFKALV